MSETDHDRSAGAAQSAWPTPDAALPPEQLTDRELIARAAYCDEIAHTGSATDQAVALRELDAAWDEAERRAAGQPPISIPAQVTGYIGLVREDYDHALAAEAATWRAHLDAALPPSEPALDDLQTRRSPTALDLDLAADRARSTATARGADGQLTVGEHLTVGERADRAQSLAQAAGVDVAGPNTSLDPDTDVYPDPDTGQVVRLDGLSEQTAVEDQGAVDWVASSAIAERDDNRPDETSAFNPAAAYSDPDWREPASDQEATARTAWLAENTPPAPGWALPPSTEVDDALDATRERAVHSDWAHDHDPQAWAQYRRLEALAELAPLPPRDALDDPEHDNPEHDNLAHDEPDARNHDGQLEVRNDPQRLRQRVEDLRAAIAAREASAQGEVDGEQRREQLARWHDDDHRPASTATDGGLSPQYNQVSDGDSEPEWSR